MLSIIIATNNEEKIIGKTLSWLINDSQEIIIVDGESQDKTRVIASEFPVRFISANKKNRAHQFNVGANASSQDILVFLHADCILEKGSIAQIESSIEKGYIGGCLKQQILDKSLIFRFIEESGNIRAKTFKIFFGDQAIFVRRDVFFELGGYDDVDIFDDVLFSRKLRKKGKTIVLKKKVYTYSRRWRKLGIVKTTLINWVVSLGFLFKVSPRILKRIYQDIR